jgi:hypothetical protein
MLFAYDLLKFCPNDADLAVRTCGNQRNTRNYHLPAAITIRLFAVV